MPAQAGRLEGKTTLITGAGQGIGRATALLFVAEGATVWACDLNPAALDDLHAAEPAIHCRVLDVRDEAAIARLAQEIGVLDVLFNCAGYVHQGTILGCSRKDWNDSFDINVTSMYLTCRAFLPGMQSAGRGNIINMASVVSSIKGAPNRFAYAASKAAVIGLTKSIATDFVASGIRCNALCPSTVDTPSLAERMAAQGDPAAARAAFIARQPMGRIGNVEEIAAAALYLASDETAYMTGQTLVLDGGISM